MLLGTMTSVLPFCAKDDPRPVLSGVILTPQGEETDVWAADGFRLALKTLPIAFPPPRESRRRGRKCTHSLYR